MKFNKNTFVDYLVSYLVMMTIPIIIFSYIFYQYFLGFFVNYLQRDSVNTLLRAHANIDIQVTQLQSNASRMSGAREFTASYLQTSFAQFFDLYDSLSDIRYSNDFLYDVMYLNNDLGYIYTPSARFTYDDFKRFGSSYDNYSEQQLESVLHNVSGAMWMPVQPVKNNTQQVLTYIIPIQYETGSTSAAAIFQIKKSTLDTLVGDTRSQSILIADGQNRVLYASNDSLPALEPSFWQVVSQTHSEAAVNMQLDGTDYLVYCQSSDVAEIRYISLIPYEQILKPLGSLKIVFLAGILLITLLCSVAIFFFMRKNYLPISALATMAKTHLTNGQQKLSVVEATRQALVNISEDNRLILAQNQKLKRSDFLLRLLRDAFSDSAAFAEETKKVGITLNGPQFLIAVMKFDLLKGTSPASYDDLTQRMEDGMFDGLEVWTVEYSEDDSIILLFSGTSAAFGGLDHKLTQLTALLKKDFDIYSTVGASSLFQTIRKPYSFFMEARAAARVQPARGNPTVTFFKDLIKNRAVEYNYPADGINAMYNAILSGNPDRIQFAADILIKSMQSLSNLFLASCLGYDIINTELRAMRELNYPIATFSARYPEIFFKTEPYGPDKMIDVIEKLTAHICERVPEKDFSGVPDAGENSGMAAILNYIKEHYTEESFSAKTLAAHLGMSISNFSHYFKTHTGYVVSDHINHLRFEKAKELLRTTDLTIGEIIVRSGYGHVSTFMRQFKQSEGITPAFYRTMYRPLIK